MAAARARAEAAEVYLTTRSSTNSPIDMTSHDRHFPDTVRRIWPYSYGWPCRRLRSDPRSRCLQSHNHSRYALQSRSGRLPARTLPNMSTAARARSAGTQGARGGRACRHRTPAVEAMVTVYCDLGLARSAATTPTLRRKTCMQLNVSFMYETYDGFSGSILVS